jgi:hypothetical protein
MLNMKGCISAALAAALIGLVSTSAPVLAQQKTVKECQQEWRANKAANQAAKITEKAFVEKCRAGEAATPAAAPAAAPTAEPAEKSAPPAPPPTRSTARPAPAVPTGAGQFRTEAQAKGHCPSDIVVWVNLTSKIYHFAGHKSYGTTKSGAYMCEKDATSEGFRASKTEKRPSA